MQDILARLRRSLADIEGETRPEAAPSPRFSSGHGPLDAAVGGGLPRGAVHEVFAAAAGDGAAAAGFALALALRMGGAVRPAAAAPAPAGTGRRGGGKPRSPPHSSSPFSPPSSSRSSPPPPAPAPPVVWVQQAMAGREYGGLYPPGLAAFGADPDRLVLVAVRDGTEALRAAHEALRCPAVAAVLMELWGPARALDLTASRRLATAAARSGAACLVVRSAAEPVPSACLSRWRVGAAASRRLAANAPGHPAFEIELLRHRAGFPPAAFSVEWDRDLLVFREPALPRPVVSLPLHRPAAAERRRAG